MKTFTLKTLAAELYEACSQQPQGSPEAVLEDALNDVFGGIKTIVDGEVEGGKVSVGLPWRWERWAVNLYGEGVRHLDPDGMMASIQRDVEELRAVAASTFPKPVPPQSIGKLTIAVETTQLGLGKQVGGDHYQMPIQHFEFVAANNIPYAEATAMKYLCRHRKKNKHQDLDKAIHYILMLRAQAYPDAPPWVNPMGA